MKSGKIAKIGTVLITCLGLAACGGGTSESARDDFIDSIFDTLKQAEIFGGVIVDAKQTTDIGFSGNIAFDMNYLDNISLDLDCTVTTSNGSKLPFGIQYVDNTLYAEYNRYKDSEIDMYMEMASLDAIGDILGYFGVNFSLDFDFSQITNWLEALEFVKASGDTEAHWELDINGTALCFSGTKKGEFTGDIWCDIAGADSVTSIVATVNHKEVVSFWTPGAQALEESWVPLDTLVDSAANTLGYNFFELTGSFDLAVSAMGFDIDLGFDNVVLDLLIDENGKLQLWMDYDVKATYITVVVKIPISGNTETHYWYDSSDESTKTFVSTNNIDTQQIHETVFYDGEYVYQYRQDDIKLTTNSLTGTTIDATDKFYTKETLSGFGSNFMDDFMVHLLALSETALATMNMGGSWVTDTTQIKYEDLLTEFTYETAHQEEVTSEDDEGSETTTVDVPERFVIGADLSSFLFSESEETDEDGNPTGNIVRSDECPITDISLELDLGDHAVNEASNVNVKKIDDIVAKATMSGAAMTLDLAVDYSKAGDLACEGALAMVEAMKEYASAHADDPVNEWVYDLAYPYDDPFDPSADTN